MNLGFRHIITIIAALFAASIMPAQDIPLLPGDPAVLTGTMPNGMAYYLVSNPDIKGTADFALVQKTGKLISGDSSGKVLRLAEDALKPQKRTSPADYLSRHEIPGYIEIADDATIFNFRNVSLKDNVLDSMLLVIMDIADRANNIDDEFLRKWYTPADQAVVLSGDIDSKAVAGKLYNMSMMMPAGRPEQRPEYRKEADEHSSFIIKHLRESGLVEISATWTSERAPREYMNTVQAEIFEMSVNALGLAAVERIRKTLKNEGIPAAEVSSGHVCSATYPYDDSFSIKTVVSAPDSLRALELVAGVMASIDDAGVGLNEYKLAEAVYFQRLAADVEKAVKLNDEYVESCVNAFLYNASLASPKERLAFHRSGNLPDTMRLRLFNGIAEALLEKPRNLKSYPAADALPSFGSSDSLDLPGAGVKLKLRSSRKEHVSGGSIWTYSNGLKVIYKKMASERVHYSLALNGGYGSVEGLEAGEGAFLADYLKTCRIGAVPAGEFIDALCRRDITMDVAVNMSDMMISGSLPEEQMPLLLPALLAVANGREADGEAFDYYKESEYLALDLARGSLEARMTAIDSIICPDYKYSPYKVKGRISEGFMKKADAYFDRRFSRVDDGVLIIVGDMDEEKLKKMIAVFAGAFRTEDTALRRPVVRYQTVSGWSTYTVDGEADNLDVTISGRMPLTMDNYIAANLASMLLKHDLTEKFRDSGMSFTLTHNCRIYPEERLNLLISVPEAPIGILADVRAVLSSMNRREIGDGELKAYKDALKNSMANEMKTPGYWIHAIALRYLDGKDLTTNYAAKIDAVTPEKVMSVFSLLDRGCKVEYVTMKK